MLASTLATELEKMTPTLDELVAASRLASAYEVFALDASAGGVPILPSGPAAGKAAMEPLLVGMSAPGAAAAIIAAAITAFWVAAATPASFPGSTAVTPPPNAGLSGSLAAAFAANIAAALSLKDAALVVATAMHTEAIIGGLVTLPSPPPVPIL